MDNPFSAKQAYELSELQEQGFGSRTFLYEQINSGALRARKRGRKTMVLRQDLEQWLASLPAYKPASLQQ